MTLETGHLVFVQDQVEGWVPATVGVTNGQGEDMSVELIHDNGTTQASFDVHRLLCIMCDSE